MPSDVTGALSASRHRNTHWAQRLGRLIPRLLLMIAVTLLVSAVALFAFRAVYADKIYPAVAVGDVGVGGMSVEDAVAAVEQRAVDLEQGTITFTYNGQPWTPTLSEIGAEIDVEASVDAAWELGRDDSAVARLDFTNQLLRSDQRVPLRTTVDRNVLASWFESVNADIDQRAVDASLVVDGANVSVKPEQNGVVIDEAAATEVILGSLSNLEPVSTDLPTLTELPRIYAADLEGPRAELAAALDAPILAVFENQEWDIPPADLTQFLTVETAYEGDEPSVELSFERDALAAYLRETFSGQVNRAPKDARIAWSDDQGGLVALDQSIDGAALRSNAFADAVADSFLSDQGQVEIPVVVTKPAIDANNLGALGIDARLARADSNYANGSTDRDHNIGVGTSLMNGELIPPGGEFSGGKQSHPSTRSEDIGKPAGREPRPPAGGEDAGRDRCAGRAGGS